MLSPQNKTVYLWLDDLRNPPNPQWIHISRADQLWDLLLRYHELGYSMVISLDHDLGVKSEDDTLLETGADFLRWVEAKIHREEGWNPDVVFYVHSANPVGVANMMASIKAINSVLDARRE